LVDEQKIADIPISNVMFDEQQYIIFMQNNQERLYRIAYNLLGNVEEAQDAVQETFIRVWQNRYKIKADSSQAWIIKIVVNLCLDLLRKHKFIENIPKDEYNELTENSIPDPLESCINQEMQIIVQKAISKLTPPYRIAVILRDIEELSYEDIAVVLGVPVSKVKSDLFRGRRKLKEILRPVL